MANVVRVRVEADNRHRGDSARAIKDLVYVFGKAVGDAGILTIYKEKQFFTSKSEKARKKRQNAIAKNRQEVIEKKLLTGQPVKAPGGLIKKVSASLRKKKHNHKHS